jgi:hypothetical protein
MYVLRIFDRPEQYTKSKPSSRNNRFTRRLMFLVHFFKIHKKRHHKTSQPNLPVADRPIKVEESVIISNGPVESSTVLIDSTSVMSQDNNRLNNQIVKSIGLKKHLLNRQNLADRINNKLLGLANVALGNGQV